MYDGRHSNVPSTFPTPPPRLPRFRPRLPTDTAAAMSRLFSFNLEPFSRPLWVSLFVSLRFFAASFCLFSILSSLFCKKRGVVCPGFKSRFSRRPLCFPLLALTSFLRRRLLCFQRVLSTLQKSERTTCAVIGSMLEARKTKREGGRDHNEKQIPHLPGEAAGFGMTTRWRLSLEVRKRARMRYSKRNATMGSMSEARRAGAAQAMAATTMSSATTPTRTSGSRLR